MTRNHPQPLPLAGEGAHLQASASGYGSLSRVRERAGVRVANARALRANSTDAEQRLWSQLRARQLCGCKFRRQYPIGSFIADFACIEEKLVVELDGGQHTQAQVYDVQRTEFMNNQGWRVIRFWNHQVLTELAGVLQAIAQTLGHPHPHPLPPAGEGVKP